MSFLGRSRYRAATVKVMGMAMAFVMTWTRVLVNWMNVACAMDQDQPK